MCPFLSVEFMERVSTVPIWQGPQQSLMGTKEGNHTSRMSSVWDKKKYGTCVRDSCR